jgi:alkylation response protein AidB-like acyl-CoA dehydrogenase
VTVDDLAAPPRTAPALAVDRDAARRFTDTHIGGYADGWDRAGAIPEDVLARIGEAGLWAPFLPTVFGGVDLPFVELGRMHEEVGRGCSSVRSLLTVHTMVAWTVNRWGTPAQREQWLPALAAGDLLGAVTITEPEAGSDTARLATTALRNDDGWCLNGVKTWITGGQRADVFLVYAQTGHGLAAFLVPRTAPGVAIEPIADVLGTRASMLATVRLCDVALGRDALVGPASALSGMVLTGMLDLGRFSVAAGSVGIVQACLDACADYTTTRTVGGRPLRELQLIRAKISDMVTDSAAARLLVERAGALKDAGDPQTIMATWVAKYFASVAAARHASAAVQIHGANGCGPDYPVARLYRDAKVMEIIEGSSELQQITIADTAYQRTSGG